MPTETKPEETDSATDAKCSKCSERLDTTGSPKWCRKCRAQYRREYEELKDDQIKGKAFADGVKALRMQLAWNFDRLGSGSFTASEVAGLILQTPAPTRD